MEESLASFAVQEFPDRFQWEDRPNPWLIESPKTDGTELGSLLNYLRDSIDPATMEVRFRDHDFFAPRIDVKTLLHSWSVCIYPYGTVLPKHDGAPSFDGPRTLTSVLDSRREIACVQLMGVALTLFSDGTYCFEDTSGG